MPDEPELMRRGELAARAGISRETLNHYLLLGLIQERAQTPSGRCFFGSETLDRLAVIETMKRDRTLKEIREWLSKGRRAPLRRAEAARPSRALARERPLP